MDLRNRMLSLHENKRLVGTVVEVVENIVAVRVGRRLITGLPVVGQSVVPGQLVYVDYTTGEPAVYAWYQRGVASTAATVTRAVNRRIISDGLVGKGESDPYAIILYDESGQKKNVYSFSTDGLHSALAAAASGDVVWLPAGTIESGLGVETAETGTHFKVLGPIASEPTGWEQPGFDDSAWGNAVIAETFWGEIIENAEPIWATNLPQSSSETCLFRSSITLAGAPSAVVMDVACDDEMYLYVNGTLALTIAGRQTGVALDQALFHAGDNTIAIKGVNTVPWHAYVEYRITFSGPGHTTVPSGVELVGSGKNSIINGSVTNEGKLTNLTVTGTITGAGVLRLVYNAGGEQITDLVLPAHEHEGYAAVDHDHDTAYAAIGHDHAAGDIDSAGASDGQVLTADGLGGAAWKTPAGGAGTLGDLADVTISSPSSGQVLKYDGSAWVNGTDATSEGGGGGDMAKATYDQDDDGKVDAAEAADSVPWTGVTDKPSTFPPEAHTHDDRYYTEGEVDTALAGKSDTGHTHTESEITDLDHTDTAALHEDVAGEIHALAEKTSPAAADELVIEDSADGYAKKRVQISNLPTGSGGATSFTDLDDVPASYTGLGGQYLRVKSSEDGLETGSPAGSGDMTKAVYDQDDDGKVDAAEAADSVPWTGVTDKPTAFPAEAHIHDERYYTETEVDTALSGKSDTAHTHDDRYHTKTALATPNSGATVDYTNIANVPPSGAGGDLVNPMTTAGDIIIGVSAGSPARLGIGAEGQVLTVVNGMPAWADAPTGTGGEAFVTIDPEIQQEFSETFSDSGVPTS